MINVENKRNSAIELLRILCIIGILLMHTFGAYFTTVTGSNLIHGIFINSLFNAGVSTFFLISGYYGIKYSRKKVIRFWLVIAFYSFILMLSEIYIGKYNFSFDIFIRLFLPLTSNKYWFMTTYMIILIFSNYINEFINKISKKELKKIILILFIIFSVIPTFTKYQFLGDYGKGIINMSIIYLIGRYLKIYKIDISTFKLIVVLIISFIIEFILNYNITVSNGTIGLYVPYSFDYSIFIVIIATATFLVFNNLNFYSNSINIIAQSVLYVYLIDPICRNCFKHNVNVGTWEKLNYLPIFLILYSCAIFVVGFIFNWFRKILFSKLEDKFVNVISNLVDKLDQKL